MEPTAAYRVILGLITANDWDIFDAVARQHPADFPSSTLATYSEIGQSIRKLLDEYNFTEGVEFHRSVAGKASSYVEIKARFENAPVKRRKHREQFAAALSELPTSDAAYDLLARDKHSTLNRVRGLLDALRTGV